MPQYKESVREAGQWLVRRLRRAGLENVQMLRTEGLPAVFAQWTRAPADAPTLLIYGHYDVQPIYIHHIDQWPNQPFDPKIEDGEFLGRGVDDNKGNLLMALQAVEAYLKTEELPVNVKFLIEAEEETGSANLAQLLRRKRKLLAADLAVSTDGGQISATQGGIPISMRGRVSFDLEAVTASHDAHSGFVGGSVPNAVHALLSVLSSLHLPNGSIAVEGFYDGVRDISDEDRQDISAFPFDEDSEAASLGLKSHYGEEGYSTLERRWLRPSLEIVGGRLVTEPYRMPKDSLGNRAAAKVLKEVMGNDVLWYMEGHSVACSNQFREYLGILTTQFGFGIPDYQAQSEMDGACRNDERLSVATFHRGRRAWAMLLHEIAVQSGLPSGHPVPCMPSAEEDK
ncbi:hypothetical protein WJX75_008994 [Coccomyxa subellipsoidea]|uniref:Zn-dependent exopeptidase n=1 Tax=Coccomyxa subellipsoidea TaxID=248742 RepID=A0ABR2YNL9_9CHLO